MRRPRPRTLLISVAVLLGLTSLAGCNGRGGSGLWQRDLEPVVLTGAQVPTFLGSVVGDLVAFRWNNEMRLWEQVPVQVDQRHLEFLSKLRNGTGTTGPKALAYSDPAANAGADALAGRLLLVLEHPEGGIGVGRHQLRHLCGVLAQQRIRGGGLYRQRLLRTCHIFDN